MPRALLFAALAALTLPVTASAQVKLQPGGELSTTLGGCTANFVYDGVGARAGKVYLGTAAHCLEDVGDPVEDGSGTEFGDVAFIHDEAEASTDYAFIEVRTSELGRVDPSLKGYPTYPTGFTVPEDTTIGDLLQISGFGVGFGETGTTQEKRQGVLQSDNAETYAMSGPSVNGDSGGPLVHIKTGKALGVISRYGFETASTDYGPTMQGVLDKAAKAGFAVTLRLAGQSAPSAAPEPTPTPAPSSTPSGGGGSSPGPGQPPSSQGAPQSQGGQQSTPPAKKAKKKKAKSCRSKKAKRTKYCKKKARAAKRRAAKKRKAAAKRRAAAKRG